MKRILLWGAAALFLVVLALAVLPFVISVDTYRGAIQKAAHDATGRTLTIAGPMRLTVFPQIGITAQDVHFSNMAGGKTADMVHVGALHIAVATLPLLTGRIRVAAVTLEKPLINLEVDSSGHSNWTFTRPAAEGQTNRGLPKDLSFSGLDITGGSIRYSDGMTGRTLALDDADLHLDMTTLDTPAALSGHLTYLGRKVEVEGRLATLQSLSAGAAATLAGSLKSDAGNVSFDGRLAADRSLSGALKADVPSVRKLGAWLGKDLPGGGGLGKLTLDAKIAHTTGLTEFTDLHLALDGVTVSGALSVATGGVRPRVTGRLAAGHLDINPYMQTGMQPGTPAAGAPAQGWSKTPLALDAVRKFDADLSFDVQSLVIRKLAIGKAALHLVLADGALNANLDPMTLYGGSGRARIDVDAHERVPRFAIDLAFDDVSMASLLGDVLGVNKIEGIGKLTLQASSSGASADAVMRAMAGKGAMHISNGRIRGVNLGLVSQTVKSALSGAATGDGAATDFTDLGGSFVIAKGVLANNDFSLAGPVLSATGKGSIDLGNRTIDFIITPKADVALANVTVPFRVRGPWNKPSYLPDLGSLAGNLVQGLASGKGDVGGLLGAMVGGGKSAPQTPKQAPKKDMGGLLGGLFGRR